MKLLIAPVLFVFLLASSFEDVSANPLSTKAPKSTKAPSAVPSFSPSASMSPSGPDACGNSCVSPNLCMVTYQHEGVIIQDGAGGVYSAPLDPGTYRICPTGAGDCEVPKLSQMSGVSWQCREENGSIVMEDCDVAIAGSTRTYACASGNPTALGVFDVFTCPGDERCYTAAPSVMPSMSPTKSTKATKLAKSASYSPSQYVDACDNTCVSPEFCALTYQHDGYSIKDDGTTVATTTGLTSGIWRVCPSGGGDCSVPKLSQMSGDTQQCRESNGAYIQEDCTAAAADGFRTYACLTDNTAATGTYVIVDCPTDGAPYCASGSG